MRFDWVSKIPFLIKTESEEAQSKNFNTKKKKTKKKRKGTKRKRNTSRLKENALCHNNNNSNIKHVTIF